MSEYTEEKLRELERQGKAKKVVVEIPIKQLNIAKEETIEKAIKPLHIAKEERGENQKEENYGHEPQHDTPKGSGVSRDSQSSSPDSEVGV